MSTCYPVTTEQLEASLADWIAAERALSTGQNYSIEGVSVSRVEPEFVTRRINELSRELCNRRAAAAGQTVGRMTPKWA